MPYTVGYSATNSQGQGVTRYTPPVETFEAAKAVKDNLLNRGVHAFTIQGLKVGAAQPDDKVNPPVSAEQCAKLQVEFEQYGCD